MDMLSPSKLVCEALSIAPVGSMSARVDTQCGMCGGSILKNEPVTELKFPTSFTLHGELYDSSLSHRCGHCSAIYETGPFLLDLATGIYNRDGFHAVAKKVNRGWAFIDPPEPPFVFSIQVNRNQHMLWRTPVCYSRDLISFRLGEKVFHARRQAIVEARDISIKLKEIYIDSLPEKEKKSGAKVQSPLGFSDLKASKIKSGGLLRWANELIEKGLAAEEDYAPLYALNHAEAWALDFVLSEIEAPEAINSFEKYNDLKSKKSGDSNE
jgi:CRISPR type IV-associated protein Csf1